MLKDVYPTKLKDTGPKKSFWIGGCTRYNIYSCNLTITPIAAPVLSTAFYCMLTHSLYEGVKRFYNSVQWYVGKQLLPDFYFEVLS